MRRDGRVWVIAAAIAAIGSAAAASEPPPLPAGLDGGPSPLPAGLDDAPPPLPPGLGGGTSAGDDAFDELEDDGAFAGTGPAVSVSGFVDTRAGVRIHEAEDADQASLGEVRAQVDLTAAAAGVTATVTADFVWDGLASRRRSIDLETGEGVVDLRAANLVFSPVDFLDVRVGRQILTWGTGDLVFLNDLFPKDYASFFLGRDDEYLKAPSDALKLSFFSDLANLDLVYTPRFDADRFLTGDRVSFYSASAGAVVGDSGKIDARRPKRWFTDDEWAARLYRTFGAFEAALYGYDGFWKSPAGADAATGRPAFPSLSVFGASLRGPIGPGIGSAEFAYYLSRDDLAGDDPLVRNSEARVLVGYEQEIVPNLTLGVQYAVDWRQAHDGYLASLPAGQPADDQVRHVLTQRWTWLTHNQNVEWSLFTFFSPSDLDAYVIPEVNWKVTDRWTVSAGGNLFAGTDDHTFYGQLWNNSNVYAAVRYSY